MPTIEDEGYDGPSSAGRLTLSHIGSGGGEARGLPRQRCGSSEVGSQSKDSGIERALGGLEVLGIASKLKGSR